MVVSPTQDYLERVHYRNIILIYTLVMPFQLHQQNTHLEAAAAGGRKSGITKRAWPVWKRMMHASIAALHRWHPATFIVTLDPNQLQDAITTRRVALSSSQVSAAWQAGFRIGFESGAGYRNKSKP